MYPSYIFFSYRFVLLADLAEQNLAKPDRVGRIYLFRKTWFTYFNFIQTIK